MDKKKIDRINELGRLSKERELTEDDIYAYEYYYKNNRKKFEPFVAPAYRGTK